MRHKAVARFLHLRSVPILQQLELEEALLRATKDAWFIVNDGSSQRAIVMGISGKPSELIHEHAAHHDIQVIRRFTGGGTVVVDADTIFTTLIMGTDHLPEVECFPGPIMSWTEQLYKPAFQPYGDFKLQENDYVFGLHKVGGNAQAITSGRWLHHTSLLWDFSSTSMSLLKNPTKQPMYRKQRDHGQFLAKLRDYLPSRETAIASIVGAVSRHIDLQDTTLEEASSVLQLPYLRGNKVVDVTGSAEERTSQMLPR